MTLKHSCCWLGAYSRVQRVLLTERGSPMKKPRPTKIAVAVALISVFRFLGVGLGCRIRGGFRDFCSFESQDEQGACRLTFP